MTANPQPEDIPMTDPTTETEQEPPPPFSQLLFAQRNGALHAELTDLIAEAAAKTMETGKPSKASLTLTISKAGKGGHQMVVADQTGIKVPQPEKGTSFFFFDEANSGLSRNDPLQPSLPLQEVPRPTGTAGSTSAQEA